MTRAFGKNGVQALIIENAIPELEEEANRLLERLTDGDMSLYFETVRQAKTEEDRPDRDAGHQGQRQPGDAPVGDVLRRRGLPGGVRPADRAVQTARPARGGALQTLIIDEGFGTQDGKGREKLVDALNAIKQDFEKIIVITHIDELKDAFATRIEVIKTPPARR